MTPKINLIQTEFPLCLHFRVYRLKMPVTTIRHQLVVFNQVRRSVQAIQTLHQLRVISGLFQQQLNSHSVVLLVADFQHVQVPKLTHQPVLVFQAPAASRAALPASRADQVFRVVQVVVFQVLADDQLDQLQVSSGLKLADVLLHPDNLDQVLPAMMVLMKVAIILLFPASQALIIQFIPKFRKPHSTATNNNIRAIMLMLKLNAKCSTCVP